MAVARQIGVEPEIVFKTLVARSEKGEVPAATPRLPGGSCSFTSAPATARPPCRDPFDPWRA